MIRKLEFGLRKPRPVAKNATRTGHPACPQCGDTLPYSSKTARARVPATTQACLVPLALTALFLTYCLVTHSSFEDDHG